jgi:hypothetical protein
VEYALLEDAKPPGVPRLPPEALLEDAAAASAWFTAERFAFIVSAQKYADHAREDLDKRAAIDYLLLRHPLLRIVHFEGGVSARTGERQVFATLRDYRGVRYRIVLPGHPIVDGLGEGKPENQNNGAPFQRARFIQVRRAVAVLGWRGGGG